MVDVVKYSIVFDSPVTHCPLCCRLSVAASDLPIRYRLINEELFEFAEGSDLAYKICLCGMIYAKDYFSPDRAREFYANGDYRLLTNAGNSRGISPSVLKSEAEHATPLIMEIYARLDKIGSVLDIGCSSGELLDQLRLFYDCRPAGLEWNTRMADYCVNERDIPCYADFDQLGGAQYDLIVLSHVLEHTLEPIDLLASMKAHLAPGGLALIQVPILMPGVPHPLVFTEASAIYTLTVAHLAIDGVNNERHFTMWGRSP